ncbi:MAG: DUF3039 domain-containing protein [Sporichthyaceae bacterium]
MTTPMEPAGGTSTIIEERVLPSTGDGDHERFAHYVVKNKLMGAMVEGTPLQALCGKVWVPSRDPNRYPVCPECKEIYDGIPKGGDDGGENS